MDWETIERPGYFGKKRDEITAVWNKEHGQGNWRLAYQWGDLVVPRDFAIQLYEDAYYEFFKKNPATLDWLVTTALDVYDTAESNVKAGLSYDVQETKSNHIHDVSIRRSVLRLGREFKGDHLMHVRWKDSEGYRINPGVVPFHMPHMILRGYIVDCNSEGCWWEPNSIEDFYQMNKILQVKK